jgi:cyclopropane-fatty-acyl-phospholipid synthase
MSCPSRESAKQQFFGPDSTLVHHHKQTTIAANEVVSVPRHKASLSKKLVFKLLAKMKNCAVCVVDLNERHHFGDTASDLYAEIHIKDVTAYRRILFGGSIGAAEAYVEGLWSSPNLTAVVRAFSRNLSNLSSHDKRFAWIKTSLGRWRHRVLNRNSKSGSRTNIAAHYDLSNAMYEIFLDSHMQYSSAIFPAQDATLEHAQEHKLKLLCERLELGPDDHLLEIGSGWGGLACFAAQHYGCKVTTTTISKAQFETAQQRIESNKLQDRVTLLLDDYRDIRGRYSKIISVEMIEAVGHQFMPAYFQQLNSLLKPGGKLLIQAITIEDQRYEDYRKNVDFIRQYIFPGGHLPAVSEICRQLKQHTQMRLHHFSDHGLDYAETLKHWNQRFIGSRKTIMQLGFNRDFMRLWEYYFCYCEGAFRENVIGLAHIVAVKSTHST